MVRRTGVTSAGLVLLLLNSAYLAAFASPTFFYFTNVVLHMGLGILLGVVWLRRFLRERSTTPLPIVLCAAVLTAGGLCGVAIMIVGAAAKTRWLLPAHIALTVVGGLPLLLRFAWNALQRARSSQRIVLGGVYSRGVSGIRGGARTGDDRRIAEQGALPDREPDRRTGEHAAGGPRAAQPVLPLVGRHERRRHHPRELLHDERDAAAGATRTSTSSGSRRRTTSRRSTTSGTASRSSTCRTSSARSRRSGAPAATITRCSSTAASIGRSRSRSTRRKRRPGSAARRATRSRTCGSTMGQGDFTIEYPPLHDLAASDEPVPAVRARSADLPRSRAASRDLPQAVPSRADAGVLLVLPQGPSRRAGEQLPLVPRLQRLRQLAGVRRVGPGRALVLLPAEAAEVRRLPHAARRVERSGGEERQGPLAPLRRREHRAAVRQPRSPCS